MWQYTLVDLTADDDPEEWATRLADHGWQMWVSTGALTTINDRQVRRYNLRRWVPPGVKAPLRGEPLPSEDRSQAGA